MFGRNRKQVRALEDLREEFSAADRNARAVLTDAMAQVELRMMREREDREIARASAETAIETAHAQLSAQAMDVGQVLQQVANTCALIAEQMEADRVERRAFAEAIARLVQASGLPADAGEHPLGGTVFPGLAPETPANAATDLAAEEVDDRSPEPAGDAVAPQDEVIDLRTPEEPPRPSRTLPRWVTKRS